MFTEFKESQFTVKGSKMSTVLTTMDFLKLPPAASAAHRTSD
jgi:hypothetical protein